MVSAVRLRNALVTAAFCLVHASASATPSVSVEGTDAGCPERAAVEREIRQFAKPPEPDEPHYRFEIGQLPNGARADLFDPDGERLFTRRIESRDCEALARAFALILHAQFVDLGIVQREPAEPQEPKQEELEPEPEPQPEPAPEPAPARPAPRPIRETPSASSPKSRQGDSWGYRVGAGLGVGRDLPEGNPMFAGVAELGTVSPGGFWLGIHLWGASPVRVGSSPDRVERWPLALELGVSGRFFETVWLEPGLSGGILVSRVRALDIDASARLSPVPVARASLRGGLTFSSVCPWLELSGQLLLDRDRYVVRPRGPIGLGPRATLALLLGADTTWF